MKCNLHIALAAVLCLAGCGTPGAPRPPSLDLPKPVSDLSATRLGDKVTLTWAPPRETTDNQNIRHPGPVRVCRAVDISPIVQCAEVAQLPPAEVQAGRKAPPQRSSYTDTLPAELQHKAPTGFVTYALESLNRRGRAAGLSNQVEVPLAPTLPPPDRVEAKVTADGPVISWPVPPEEASLILSLPSPQAAPSYHFRLYRHDVQQPSAVEVAVPIENASSTPSLPTPNESVLDTTAEWEHTYRYRVAVITNVKFRGTPEEIEGNPSPPVEIFVHDVFPPATPSGVEAVASGVGQPAFIDLTWTPDTDPDLAGYNVYRHHAGEPPVKINTDLVKTPAYRDRGVQPGHTYLYSVSAVDMRGNESGRSAETSESVP